MKKKLIIIIFSLICLFMCSGWYAWGEGFYQRIKNKETIFENTNRFIYIKMEEVSDKVNMNNLIIITKSSDQIFLDYDFEVMNNNNFYKFKTYKTIYDATLVGDKINIYYSPKDNKITEICKYK